MKEEKRTKEYLELTGRIHKILETLMEGEPVRVTFQQGKEDEEDMLLASRTENGQMTVQCYHMEEIWRQYTQGVTVETITAQISEALGQYREISRKNPTDKLHDYEAIKENLIIRPKNYPGNREKLDLGICRIVGDIALALYVNVGNYRQVYSSFLVPRSMLRVWNKAGEEVFKAAFQNTYDLFPPRTYQWYDCLSGDADMGEFMSEEGGREFRKCPWGVFVSNREHINGAVSIFLPGVAKRLSQLMDSDLYIGFTSMHEAVIHDWDSVSPKQIKDALLDLNRSIPSPEDFLSDKVYYYNRTADTIQMSVALN